MENRDKENFAMLLTGLAETYGKSISEGVLGIWWDVLKTYDLSDVQRAISDHMRDADKGQWMPKPADLIRQIDGSGETRALRAWSKVWKAAGSVGQYQSVVFDDKTIHRVIETMGGWIKLCRTSLEEEPFVAKEFQRRYTGDKNWTVGPEVLIGVAEMENQSKGLPIDPPRLISDETKAIEHEQARIEHANS